MSLAGRHLSHRVAAEYGTGGRFGWQSARDIRTLEEAGIPIGSEAGKGYFLVEGFLLPPVMFTAAEVGALITAGKFLNCHGDESFIKDFDSAMYKITRLHHSNVILLSACFHISDCW